MLRIYPAFRPRRDGRRALTALSLAVLFALGASLAAQERTMVIVVNVSNPASSASSAQISELFLKKKRTWSNGLKAEPVDQAETKSVRRDFSRRILGKETSWIKSYWQKMIFSGRATPPLELTSDREVTAFVAARKGAIGYVSAATRLGEGVKVLRVVAE